VNDNTDPAVGTNVRQARLYAGLTLELLAGRIGRSKGWLSMIENGRLALNNRADIAAIAEACEVSADALLGQPAPEIRPRGQRWGVAPFRAMLLDATLDDPPDTAARPLPALGEVAGEMDQALRRADYAALHQDLPGLLGELQVHAAGGDGGRRDRALRLLVGATATASIALKHLGRTDLAWIAGPGPAGCRSDRGPGAAGGCGVRVRACQQQREQVQGAHVDAVGGRQAGAAMRG
jgi:transcriptional regulator with XRE-family HTH domain